MEDVARCNLCGSTRHELFTTKKGVLTSTVFRVLRCLDCSLMFVNPRLTEAENRALYDEDYFNGKGFDPSINYVMLEDEMHARRQESLAIVRKIEALRPGKDVKILDVGCGTGAFLRTLRDLGYENAEGVEFSRHGAELAARNSGARVRAGSLDEIDFGDERFDAINATEVVERVRDPRAFFRRIRSLLAPGGVFLYTTGNADGIYARVLGTRWPYITPEGHLFYFSAKTLTRYFRDVGLGVLELDGLGSDVRSAIIRADAQIADAQLSYVGASDPGMKGRIFRAVKAVSVPPVTRLMSRVVGKGLLPIGVNRGS